METVTSTSKNENYQTVKEHVYVHIGVVEWGNINVNSR